MAHRTPRPRRNATYPCIVASKFVIDEIDPRIAQFWPDAKFGDLRKTWRKRHCAVLNPYGSEWCPYSMEDCGLAYLVCATQSKTRSSTNPMGYFWRTAQSMALDRADNKPLVRDTPKTAPGSGNTSNMGAGDTTRHGDMADMERQVRPAANGDSDEGGMRRRNDRPIQIGTLLGALDLRSRQGSPDDGEAGAE